MDDYIVNINLSWNVNFQTSLSSHLKSLVLDYVYFLGIGLHLSLSLCPYCKILKERWFDKKGYYY